MLETQESITNKKGLEIRPLPAGKNKSARNRQDSVTDIKRIHKRSTALERSIKTTPFYRLYSIVIDSKNIIRISKGKVTNSQLGFTNESQEVSPFPAGDQNANFVLGPVIPPIQSHFK